MERYAYCNGQCILRWPTISDGKKKIRKTSWSSKKQKIHWEIKISGENWKQLTSEIDPRKRSRSQLTRIESITEKNCHEQSSEITCSKKKKTSIEPNKSQKTRVNQSKRNKSCSKHEKTWKKSMAPSELTPNRTTTCSFDWQKTPLWNSIRLRYQIWSCVLLQFGRWQSWILSKANWWAPACLKLNYRNTIRPQSRKTLRTSNIPGEWRRAMSHDSDSQS